MTTDGDSGESPAEADTVNRLNVPASDLCWCMDTFIAVRETHPAGMAASSAAVISDRKCTCLAICSKAGRMPVDPSGA
jgi:hypothetical protein